MTQLELARKGETSSAMVRVAVREGLEPELIRERVADGTVVIPANVNHRNLDPAGVGKGLKTKVNANIGTSSDYPSMERELDKLQVVMAAKADAVMDLSTGGDIDGTRRAILAASSIPVGLVPLYQAGVEAIEEKGTIVGMSADDIFAVIEKQAEDGIDFITVHCGVTQESIRRLRTEGRVVDVVSRGGAFMTGWMLHHDRENPLYEQFDRLLEICRRYDVTLSLGDGLRPGCLADATDRGQVQELLILGELVERSWAAGVQVMVEGPGHVPLDQVAANMQLQKRICKGAPFYVLGPLVTDVGAGYDHITAAIGGAIAAMNGADFLCYVTPAEHLGLPDFDDVREGIMATRIAGHAADIVKGVKGAWEWDLEMAKARKALDWEAQARLSIDPEKAAKRHAERPTSATSGCSMCGSFCAMNLVSEYLGTAFSKC